MCVYIYKNPYICICIFIYIYICVLNTLLRKSAIEGGCLGLAHRNSGRGALLRDINMLVLPKAMTTEHDNSESRITRHIYIYIYMWRCMYIYI